MDDRTAFAQRYLQDLADLLARLPNDAIGSCIALLEDAREHGRRVFLAGNGGSAATASHMANDLMKTVTKTGGKALRAISLSDNAQLVTAIANDEGYERIFSEQLRTLAHDGDLLIVISGSGNSPNLLRAVECAKEHNVRTIAFLGMDGGTLNGMVDLPIVVPSHDYGPIEDVHMIFNHLLTAWLRESHAQ